VIKVALLQVWILNALPRLVLEGCGNGSVLEQLRGGAFEAVQVHHGALGRPSSFGGGHRHEGKLHVHRVALGSRNARDRRKRMEEG